MAGYSVRSLAELSTQARGFFTQTIPGAIASVWANTFTVVGKVIALLNFEHELRRRWLFQQMFASTADDTWLERHAFELGLTRQPAAKAFGHVAFVTIAGTVIPSGIVLTRADGATFRTISGATATGPSTDLPVEAVEPGVLGNSDVGAVLTRDPTLILPGFAATGVVDGDKLSGGADREKLEALRARVLARKRQIPNGGSAADYMEWVREALPTVKDVYVDSFANDQRSVWVLFTVTDQPNGVPSTAQLTTVQAYVDDLMRRPITARVFVVAPSVQEVSVTIRSLNPDTPDTRAAIEAELEALFEDRAEPGRPSGAFSFSRSWINEAVSRATGEDRHVLALPATDLVFTAGNMPVLGSIFYTD